MRAGLIALAVLCAGCGDRVTPPVNPGLPVVLRVDAPSPALVSVPAAAMRDALKAGYRIKPDTRFLAAAAEIHRLLTGTRADTVRVRWADSVWSVEYEGEHVGDLRDLPDYTDGMRLLLPWAERLLAQHPLAQGNPPAASELAKADTLLSDFSIPKLAAGLEAVDAVWQRSHDPAVLPHAALGLTELALQVPRAEPAADPLVARALATCVVAIAAEQGGAVLQERVLLAERMGYVMAARALADSLGAADPARRLVWGDSAALRVAADAPRAPDLTQYLYLLQLVADDNTSRVEAWIDGHYRGALPSGIEAAELALEDFGTDGSVAPIMPVALAGELHEVTHHRSFQERVAESFPFLPLARFAMVDWMRAVSPDDSNGGALLQRFEVDLMTLDTALAGPFLDRDVFATYFRAQLHFAFERACIHYVDGLAAVRASRDFSAAYKDAPLGLWADAAQWCRHRATLGEGGTTVLDLVHDVATLRGLSTTAVDKATDDVSGRINYLDSSDVLVTRAAFARFDSRPDQLHSAALLAYSELRDVPLSELLHRRVWEMAAANYPYFAVWEANYVGDTTRLRTMAADPGFERGARHQAVLDRLTWTKDTIAALQALERVIAEDPDDWDVRRDYIEFLERRGRPADAARVAREWLDTPGHTRRARGFDYIAAVTALARQLERMGRPAEGLALVEPLARSYQLGAMQRTALIYIDLHRVAAAESLARKIVARYPDSPYGRITLTQALWAQERWGEAASVLRDPKYPLAQEAWRDPVAPAFVLSFGHRPVAAAESAVVALRGAGATVEEAADLTSAADDSSYHQLAWALEQLALANGGGGAGDLTAYRLMAADRGVAAAQEWLRSRWGAAGARRNSLEVFRRGEYDLLWTMGAVPDDGPEGSYLWVMRALAWLLDPKHDPARHAELVAHFRQRDPRYYHIAGRYLLGMESEATLLAFADTPHHRCEISYDMGIKALSDGRYAEGSDWLRVTVELRNGHDWEQLWAKDLLQRLIVVDRPLPAALPKVLATRPRW